MNVRAKIQTIKRKTKSFLTKERTYILICIALLLITAPFIVAFIEFRHHINNLDPLFHMLFEHPRIFWYNTAIILAISIVLTGLIGDAVIAIATQFAIFIFIMFIDSNKFIYREAPLLPEDLQQINNVSSFTGWVDIFSLSRTIAIAISIIVLSVLISRYLHKKFSFKFPRREKTAYRATLIVIGLVFLVAGTDFIRHTKGDNYEINNFLKTEFVAWNQTENYDRNGFVIGFIYNLQPRKMKEPANYTEETISAIVAKYQEIADRENQTRINLSESDISIVYVMNESFFDPSALKAYYPYTGGNVTPNLHRFKGVHPSGYMYSSEYGGNTANIEFEAYTGFTNYFFTHAVPFSHIVSKYPNFPSFASFLKNNGYQSTGIHPFSSTMYKRNIVYPNLGFSKFLGQSDLSYTESVARDGYISDRAAYKQVLDTLNSSDSNQFIALVTMQNHMPYNRTVENTRGFLSTSGADNDTDITNYLELLYKSDEALGYLIKELGHMDRKVLLVFWGDHLPGLYGNLPDHVQSLRQKTPLMYYSNFDAAGTSKIGTLSANYISNTALNVLDAQKPAFYYLQDDLQTSHPTLTHSFYREQTPPASDAFTDYELINYDILSGKKYSQPLNFYQ